MIISPSHANTCASLYSNSLNFNLEEYKKNSLPSKLPGGIPESWMNIVTAISETNKTLFMKLSPRSMFPKVDQNSGQVFQSTFGKGIRSLDYTEGETFQYTPKFYHMTSIINAKSILNTNQIKLSKGSHNKAAICLGDASFPHYQKSFNSFTDVTLLTVTLRDEAKVLDLTQDPFGKRGPSEFSYYNLFKWYQDNFLSSIASGEYSEEFPELTHLLQTQPELIWEMSSKEAFGLLIGADVLYVSELYGPKSVDEYWVINPQAIKNTSYDRGANPK